MRRWIGLGCILVTAVATTRAAGTDQDFDARVAPVLARHCLDCHSGADPKGKLDLSARAAAFAGGEGGEAIVAGKPDESLLWEKVASGEMPPKSPLTEAEKSTLKAWIAGGASWGADPIDPYQVTTARRAGRDWWSLQPVRRPTPPTTTDGRARTPIDAFVLHALEANGLAPAPEAGRRELIRRLTFDLIGLPPTPAEIDAFVADRSETAYEILVDRLLASPQYGVRWARWWLDLARYGESGGFEYDEFRPSSWRYRDWVVGAFNRDMPYDEFTRLQIAGDVLRPRDAEAVEATGFLVAGAYDTAGQNQISQAMRAVVRADEVEDLVGTVAQTFLGLTVNCARCHDHKFDPIRQAEYYQFVSALDGVRHGEVDLSDLDPKSIARRSRIAAIEAEVATIEAPARAKLLGAKAADVQAIPPSPMAAWDFKTGGEDRVGHADVALHGGASLSAEGLALDGKEAYAITPPLGVELHEKTLEAWVRLEGTDQRGGGVVSVVAEVGGAFDAVVFGESEPGRWMAGSENFVRTSSVGGPAEVEAGRRFVHVAIRYSADGMIQAFRDGRRYGKAYHSTGPAVFAAGRGRVAFGIRHLPVGGNRMLRATIARARLYDRALTDRELEASASSGGTVLEVGDVIAALDAEARSSRERLLEEARRLRASLAVDRRKAYAVAPRPAGATRIQIRGNPGQPGEVVAAGGIASLAGTDPKFGLAPDAPEAERRIRLAGWIADARNPLFARVVVNRLWLAHFGSGLVETTSDFGFNGGVPSHPELLDWLASELPRRGWSLKAMHRLIVTSAAYWRSSRPDPEGLAKDAGDRLLWRKQPARLEAEMVRDAMLATAGVLDPATGGPSFRDHEPRKAEGTTTILYVPTDPASPGQDRRTLYRAWARGGRSAFLDAFDCPDPSTTAPRRAATTTPLQALSLMNNAMVLHLSDAFAKRLVREAGPDAKAQVALAYRLALGRPPQDDEFAEAAAVVDQFGAAALARALFNSNEFLYLD
ncbi:DUF1553 domain-containing protein [Paludisphaera mucosa]|uniref:DUF1553 domain-containing protein n=1 Tax=Paludisphaera mucosa TaxID=3030827 RepID=A0ABT6FBR4_9BACT|nr:DUF1553 domain-containing protein [Paludisphaera mucosa]MDG3005007.1 DUF1553 domain-containing protein [Paludisphaera mucosa]